MNPCEAVQHVTVVRYTSVDYSECLRIYTNSLQKGKQKDQGAPSPRGLVLYTGDCEGGIGRAVLVMILIVGVAQEDSSWSDWRSLAVVCAVHISQGNMILVCFLCRYRSLHETNYFCCLPTRSMVKINVLHQATAQVGFLSMCYRYGVVVCWVRFAWESWPAVILRDVQRCVLTDDHSRRECG